MPNNPRQAVKQTLQSVMNELTKAGEKLIPLSEMYEKDHPDHFQGFVMLIQGCADLKDATQILSDNI